jgi:hypothetical protein
MFRLDPVVTHIYCCDIFIGFHIQQQLLSWGLVGQLSLYGPHNDNSENARYFGDVNIAHFAPWIISFAARAHFASRGCGRLTMVLKVYTVIVYTCQDHQDNGKVGVKSTTLLLREWMEPVLVVYLNIFVSGSNYTGIYLEVPWSYQILYVS